MTTALIQYLQQSPTFRPFVWQLVLLAAITGLASQHNEIDIVPGTGFRTGDGNGMVKVIAIGPILTLLKFGMAIVASILLSFQFVFDLLSGQSAFNAFLAGAPFLPTCPTPCKKAFRLKLALLLSPLVHFCAMSLAVVSEFPTYFVFVGGAILFVVFSMSVIVDFIIFFLAFFTPWVQPTSRVLRKIFNCCRIYILTLCTAFLAFWNCIDFSWMRGMPSGSFALLALSPYATRPILVGGKEFTSSRLPLLTRITPSQTVLSIYNLVVFSILFFADLTESEEAIRCISSMAEKFRGGRLPFKASIASFTRGIILGYNSHAAKLQSLSSRFGVFPAPPEQNILTPTLYHEAASKARLGGVL